jgi:dATP pyrophosphohydrolase
MIHLHLFQRCESGPKYLLIRRSPDERIYPGLWQMVTGMMEPNEKAYQTALREIGEETGLTPEVLWVVPFVASFYNPFKDEITLIPVFAAEVNPAEEVNLSEEHDIYQWCLYEEALERFIIPGYKEGLRILHQFIVTGENADKFLRVPLGNKNST